MHAERDLIELPRVDTGLCLELRDLGAHLGKLRRVLSHNLRQRLIQKAMHVYQGDRI